MTAEYNISFLLCYIYPSIIPRVYKKIKSDFPKLDKHLILSIAVHVVNVTTGPEGLSPSLLLF